MQTNDRTYTPQEFFAHVGRLEDQAAIALISKEMLGHSQWGLWAVALDDDDRSLLGQFEALLSNYQETTRAQWATLKESCLLLLGSHVASSIDHLISAMRTPAIAESAIRSAGFALISANEAKAKKSSQAFMRSILGRAVEAG